MRYFPLSLLCSIFCLWSECILFQRNIFGTQKNCDDKLRKLGPTRPFGCNNTEYNKIVRNFLPFCTIVRRFISRRSHTENSLGLVKIHLPFCPSGNFDVVNPLLDPKTVHVHSMYTPQIAETESGKARKRPLVLVPRALHTIRTNGEKERVEERSRNLQKQGLRVSPRGVEKKAGKEGSRP